MLKQVLGTMILFGAVEASATVCRGQWTYEEWNSCRHKDNGIEAKEVIENGVTLKPVSKTFTRTYTSTKRFGILSKNNSPEGRYKQAVDRCNKAFKDFMPEIKKKPELSTQTWTLLSDSMTISDYSEKKTAVPGYQKGTFNCKFKGQFFEEKYIAIENPTKVSPVVYFNKPNPLCGRTKKVTSPGFDHQSLEFENGQKVNYRSKFVCSTGEHLEDTTPKELAIKLEFLLTQLRKSKVDVSELEKSLITRDIDGYIANRESDIDEDLFNMLLNNDFYTIDFEDNLQNKSMISLHTNNGVGNVMIYNIMSDDIALEEELPLSGGVQDHGNKYGLNSTSDTMYYLDEYYTSISKMNLSNKTSEKLINLDARGGYYTRGMFVSEDESRLVTHLVHSYDKNDFEEIALWDLELKTKIESIFLFKGTFSEVLNQEHKTAFDQKTGKLYIGQGKKISVYDINMNAEIASIDLLKPLLNLYIAKDGTKIGVVENGSDEITAGKDDRVSTVEIFDTEMFGRIDMWSEKGLPVLTFGGSLVANDMGMGDDDADMGMDMGMGDDDMGMGDDNMGMGDDVGSVSSSDLVIVGSSYQAQKYLPRGQIRIRELANGSFLDDVPVNPGFGFISSLDLTEDSRYLLISSYDRNDLNSPFVKHLRVIDIIGNDFDLEPGVVKDFVDSKLATNFFFMDRLDTMAQQVIEMARIAKVNASDKPSQGGLVSLKSLGIDMRAGQPMTDEMEGNLSNYGVEIQQDCSWASLPYIYQFADGVVYVTGDRKKFNVFTYDKVISKKCAVKNLPLATGGMLFNKDISPVALGSTINPATGETFKMPEFNVTVNQDVLDLIEQSGEPVILNCSWASFPYAYKFQDSYMFLSSTKSKANVFPVSTVSAKGCLGDNEVRFTK